MKISDYIASVVGEYNPFVVQGGAAIHMIDSLQRGGYKYVCTAHEQAAGFAADGYAKMRGLGVAVTTCGPGATNLLTAAASAYFEQVPVLYLVGQQHGFQELDLVGMFRTVTKYAKLVDDPSTLATDLYEAISVAKHKQGPVLLNIFDEVYRADIKAESFPKHHPVWRGGPETDQIFAKKRTILAPGGKWESEFVNPYHFMQELDKHHCMIVTDIGNHGVWVKQTVKWVIADNSFGAMGYALPAAMGVACAGHKVACITGDGAIQMNIQELATIAKHDMDIKIFVLNNGGYGMIRCTQDTWLEGRHAGCDHFDLPFVEFERVAKAYGIPSRTWRNHGDIDFASVFGVKGPCLVNVLVDPEQEIC